MPHLYFLKDPNGQPDPTLAVIAHRTGDHWHLRHEPPSEDETLTRGQFFVSYVKAPGDYFRTLDGGTLDPNKLVDAGTHALTFCATEDDAREHTTPHTHFLDVETRHVITGRTPRFADERSGTIEPGEPIPLVPEAWLPALALIPTTTTDH
ncbi:hypothetical protein CHEID_07250 [Corynebacterium heidelbergense]|nr:hypothetical protein [Corynebacterium heidelbergense]WCZ36983.1 hypothetical protein CHEID_07250 [Corynebacterium heidelbergense]